MLPAKCLRNYFNCSNNCPLLIPDSVFNINNRPIICEGNRCTYHVIRGNNYPVVFTHQSCMCNEQIAFLHRHMTNKIPMSDGKTIPIGKSLLSKYIQSIFPKFSTVNLTYDQFISRYSGRFRRKYENAKISLVQYGIQPKHFINRCFLKDDKYHMKPDEDFSIKAPRAIQYQSGEATMYKGVRIVPLEEEFYKQTDIHGLKIFTKGLDQISIADLIIKSSAIIPKPVYIENDYSAFDSHVCVEWLQLFREYICSNFEGKDKRALKWAMSFDDNVLGYTSRGIKYRITGTLTSGSIDTSFKGNFINYVVVTHALKTLGVPLNMYKFIVNGDDSVLILSSLYLEKFMSIDFNQYHLSAKPVVKYDMFDVEFCQAKLVVTPLGFTMLRNPLRMFQRIGWMVENRKISFRLAYIKTVLMGEMALNYMVPVIYPLLRAMYKTIPSRINTVSISTYVDEVYRSSKFWKLDTPYIHSSRYDYAILDKFPFLLDINPVDYMSQVDYDEDVKQADLLDDKLYSLRILDPGAG